MSSDVGAPIVRLCIVAVVAGATSAWMGCQPPAHSAYISMTSRAAGALDVSGYVGGGSPVTVAGGGQVEPYAGARLSFPIALNVGWGRGTEDLATERETDVLQWYLTGRVGIRYRFRELVSIGGGVSGGYSRYIDYVQPVGPPYAEGANSGSLLLDLEIALGHRWPHVGLSFAVRPSWEALLLYGFHIPIELALVWYPSGERWGVVLSGMFDIFMPGDTGVNLGGAGGLGFVFHR